MGKGRERGEAKNLEEREPEKGRDDWLAAAGSEGTSPGTAPKAGTLWAVGNANRPLVLI